LQGSVEEEQEEEQEEVEISTSTVFAVSRAALYYRTADVTRSGNAHEARRQPGSAEVSQVG
jgi:hypothetical protein